jgi:hypothetical protein
MMRLRGLSTRIGLAALLAAGGAAGVELRPETRGAFEGYVRQAEARIEAQVARGFLFADNPERRAALGGGAILSETRIPRGELKVPAGLVHDWVGAVFIPDAGVLKTLEVVQAYDRHGELYRPEVVASRLLERSGNDFRVRMRLLKKKVLTVVLDTEHAVRYEEIEPARWWSRSRSTRIVEIQDAGKPRERPLAPDTGHGFLWRLNSYWTFREMDGGTYVECEAISLTRDVPRGLGWLIQPIVRTLPRESLVNTLRATRAAVARAVKE